MFAAASTHMTVRIQSRPNQKLLVPLRSRDRAFLNSQHSPARQPAPPSFNPFANRLMHRRIAHHAFGADRSWPSLELRFYQCDGPWTRDEKCETSREDGGQADETRIAHQDLDRIGHICRGQVTSVRLLM